MHAPKSAAPGSSPRDPLARFPAAVREAYARYRAAGAVADADLVIFAVLQSFLPGNDASTPLRPLPDQARLIEDLGLDSIAIAEFVFFVEDLFKVTVRATELQALHTVQELHIFIREKLAARPASTAP